MANVWDVYTLGDVSFIHEVFLGVSHIFYGTGENVFLQVYMIGMLLGFIWIFIESMIQQKPIALGRFFVAFIIYSALFVPRATVHLEDSQTKKFYTMDNIPLGLAVGSSIVSKVGSGLTHVFEDYFTPVGGVGSGCSPTKTTCAGYLGSLSKIVQIRENLASQPAFVALDRAICGEDYRNPPLPSEPQVKCSIQKSVSNYVRHCGVNRFIQNPQLLKSVRSFNDFRYNNFSYNTDLYLWPDKPRVRNCYEAFIDIDTALTKHQSVIEELSIKPQWLSGMAHDTTGGGDVTAQMVTGAGVNHNQISEILSLMTGASGTTPDVFAYIKNVMLRGPIEDGLMAGYADVGDARASLMIKSARDQRNIQWAAEENMWISTAKAMATFFEGFVVALVVLIPFVMFMGGLNIMIEYLKVLMWVQLWNPVMAICNLYIQTAASQKVRDAIANSPITDMYVMDSVDEVVQHWIAVGGLMAATTPLLALFILKGSVYTFTTLASRMSGGDHVNEKAVSPDVMQHAPMLANSMGAWNADESKGPRAVGMDGHYATIAADQVISSMLASGEKDVKSKSRAYSNAVTKGWEWAISGGHSDEVATSFLNTLQANDSKAYKWVTGKMKEVQAATGIQDQTQLLDKVFKGVENATTVNAGGKITVDGKVSGNEKGVSFLGSNGDSSASVGAHGEVGIDTRHTARNGQEESTSNSHSVNESEGTSEKTSGGDSYEEGLAYAESINKAKNAALKDVLTKQGRIGEANNISNSYTDLKNSESSFTEQKQKANSLRSQKSMDSGQWSRQYMDDASYEKFMKSLDTYSRIALRDELRDGHYYDGKTGSQKDVDKAALLEWAVNSGRTDDISSKFWDAFDDKLPLSSSDGYNSNSNLKGQKITDVDGSSVRGKAQDQVNTAGQSTSKGTRDAVKQDQQRIKIDNSLNEKKNELEIENFNVMALEGKKRQELFYKALNDINGVKNNKELKKFDQENAPQRLDSEHKDKYLKHLSKLLSGEDSINRLAAQYGLRYMEENWRGWCDDRNNTRYGQSKTAGHSMETDQKYYERTMNDPERKRQYLAAVEEIKNNMGVSQEEAESFMKHIPTLMRGTLIEYEGLRHTWDSNKDSAVLRTIEKSKVEAVLNGESVQEDIYKVFREVNPDFTNDYAVTTREFFHDRGYRHLRMIDPDKNNQNYMQDYWGKK